MAGHIECQAVGEAPPNDQSLCMLQVLPGAIEGVQTNYYFQAGKTEYSPLQQRHRGHAFLFVRGAGDVQTESEAFSVSGIAALCPMGEGRTRIKAASGGLEYLEILVDLQAQETALVLPHPFFVTYSQCEPYAEAIKSPKTTSRTIVPVNILPRFCMGSVETAGPDTIGAHSHPMLEQLFFGLAGNRCIVTAEGLEAELGERVLLHIPSGSWHGVRVEEGRRLHYIWMDFFRDEAGLAYIHEQHKPLQGNAPPDGRQVDREKL